MLCWLWLKHLVVVFFIREVEKEKEARVCDDVTCIEIKIVVKKRLAVVGKGLHGNRDALRVLDLVFDV